MPPPPSRPSRAVAPVTRRAVLLGAAGAVLTGCTGGLKVGRDGRGRPGRRRTSDADAQKAAEQVDPDVALAATALAVERHALAAVEATQDRHARLRVLLDPAAEAHRAHVALLADAVPDEGASATPATTAIRVPRSRRRAVGRLVELEAELAATGRLNAFQAQSGPFARLLASMAASAGQQEVLLGGLTVPGGPRR